MDELIKAKDIKIADLLRGGCFSVPRHQRYYDWEERQVDDLLNDLYESAIQNKPCYFLGSIMLIQDGKPNQFEINDGQQRIITFSMICAYFCRLFNSQSDSGGESSTLRILFDIAEGTNETLADAERLTPRVIPPRNDKANFNRLIRGDNIGRNGKMVSAWNQISNFFDQKENFGLEQQKELLAFMLDKITVIRLEVDNSLDVNAIYETLNSRGKNLDDVDLIKNYFLSFFSNDKNSIRHDEVYEKFEKISTASVKPVSGYVRCCMQVQHGFIRKEQFFRGTKQIFPSPKEENSSKVFKFVDSIAECASLQIFKALLRKTESQDFLNALTAHARKSNKIRKIDSYFLDLHDYKITRPIMFALLFCYSSASPADKKKVASFVYGCSKLLSSFVQRISHVSSSFKPSEYEEHFAKLAKDINDRRCHTEKIFFDCIKQTDKLGITDDRQYINLMNSKFYGKNSLGKSKYILRSIVEWQEQSGVIADAQISIEHILPKSEAHYAQKDWTGKFNRADCEKLVHSLGNLTLLSKQQNKSTAEDNASFAKKKQTYENSSFKLTRDICGCADWTPEQIKCRQSYLVKIAAKQIWDFDNHAEN